MVIGIDTNVLVRLLTADDAKQYETARTLFRDNHVFIPDTVWLETEWVLRFAYSFERENIVRALRGVLGLPNVEVGELAAVDEALDAYEQGMDFADAMHWVKCRHCERFASFDRRFVNRSKTLQWVPVPVDGLWVAGADEYSLDDGD